MAYNSIYQMNIFRKKNMAIRNVSPNVALNRVSFRAFKKRSKRMVMAIYS